MCPDPEQLARLLNRRGPAAGALGHPPRLGDQLAVRPRRQIAGRVSRGSITSSIMSLPAAMYTSMIRRNSAISSAGLASGSGASAQLLAED
jgi:hypothetical protein